MHQFTVNKLHPINIGGFDASFTNSSLWMLVALAAVSIFLFVGTARPQLVPSRWQAAVEYIYDFVRNMLDTNVGPEGRAYAPLIFSIFLFVLACNLLGLIPWVGAFTPTSHVAVTFGLAMIVFVTVVVVGFLRHGLHFFSLFWPHGTNVVLGAFVFVIEFLSFLSRPFTLAIRLFANMTAGHVLLQVFGTFVVALGSFGALPFVFGLLPLGVNIALSALEVLIAVVQAYVFALLASIYLNDAINLH
ncbi:MAG: F0F1 ATP synthase subunit A [Sphingomonas sp.]|jgi:F-type H+-transporting ATPase subunit a|uniref:F0F1 ATP synthase subunit A n=1 Tax=Sphingomonas sp. TaxID=28214 RepID=UPI0025FC7446|nr:F0F1 ATP synthase subunit A [Sphingomonas sp.]MBX9881308.1 F0F1 ATP synthase subunit A [Sphingomonas sp.]